MGNDPFVEKVIGFYVSELEGKTTQRGEKIREQLEGLVSLFFKGSERAKEDRVLSDELIKQFGGGSRGFFDFLNELMKKSYGYKFSYRYRRDEKGELLKEKEFVKTEVSFSVIPARLNIFDLLRLAEFYQAPDLRFKPSFQLVEPEDASKRARLVLNAHFEEEALSQVLNRVFEETEVCTKNKQPHSLAGYLDAADPFTHRLRVGGELISLTGDGTAASGTPSPSLLEATIIECEGRKMQKGSTERDYLLVEGVYGTVGEEERGQVFDYLYACLIDFAYREKKGLLFNICYNTKSQQEPTQFINHVGSIILGREIYPFDSESKRCLPPDDLEKIKGEHKYNLEALTLGDKSRRVRKIRKVLEKKISFTFSDPVEVLDNFCLEEKYADTWQPFEFRGRRKLPQQDQKKEEAQWNQRKGEAYCLEIDYETVVGEYKRLFPKEYRKQKSRRFKVGLGVVGGALLAGLVGLLELRPPEVRCTKAKVDNYTLTCIQDNQIESIFSIEGFEDIERGTGIVKATYDKQRYKFKFGGKRGADSFDRAREKVDSFRQEVAGIEQGIYCNPNNSSNVWGKIADCTGEWKLPFRISDLVEGYKKRGLGDKLLGKIYSELVEIAYRTGNAYIISRIVSFLSSETIFDLLKWSDASNQETEDLLGFLVTTARVGDEAIRSQLVRLFSHYVYGGDFRRELIKEEESGRQKTYSLSNGYSVLEELVNGLKNQHVRVVKDLVDLAWGIRDDPYDAGIIRNLLYYDSMDFFQQLSASQFIDEKNNERIARSLQVGLLIGLYDSLDMPVSEILFRRLVASTEAFALSGMILDGYAWRAYRTTDFMRDVMRLTDSLALFSYDFILREDCVYNKIMDLENEEELNTFLSEIFSGVVLDDLPAFTSSGTNLSKLSRRVFCR